MDALVFSHANGFPLPAYRRVLEGLADTFRTTGVMRFGHDPARPVTVGWPYLVDELVEFVHAQPLHAGRTWLVGHSLGGYLSLLAATRAPEIARGVVLVDSPVLGGWRAHSVQVAKATRLIGRVSPGRVSKARRNRWPSAEAAHAHFAAKHVFARWDPRVLADYIGCGTEPAPEGGVQLAFRREVETQLYNTLPHHFDRVLKRHPPACPVLFLGGTQSAEVRQVGLPFTRAVTRGRMRWLEGSHLFPMERPDETADAVLASIGQAGA